MIKKLLLHSLFALLVSCAMNAAQLDKIAYPTADDPSFIISVPSNWEMTQAKEDGDFFHVEGPTGALFSFRTIKGSSDSLNEAVDESIKEAQKLFKGLTLDDPKDWKPHGLEGFYAIGEGKQDGKKMRVGMGWCLLKNGQIAELWFVADIDDEKGIGEAEDIANSLQAP